MLIEVVLVVLTLYLVGIGNATLACAKPVPALNDSEYVAIARATPEGREFTIKYGDGLAYVDHSGRLAVDLYANRSGQSVRLRIFIDDNRAASSFFECPPGTVSTDVIGAIGRCG